MRVDNLSDSQRKGIIQLMTVGANTPYMDIIYGLKTDPNNALKGRLGNLKGIVHPILGELSGFGEFLNNLYAVGDFIIQRTGESVDSKLQVLENMFSSRFSQTSYELTNSDNYLENGQFLEQVRDDEDTIISCWAVDTTDESMFWADALGNPFMVNGLLSVSGNRKVSIDKMDGRQVLRLQNCGVKQLNAHIRQPGTHKEYQQPSGSTGDNGLKKPATGSTDVQDRLYISIRIFAKTAGTLTVGFEGCSSVSGKSNTLTAQNVAVPYSGDWTNIPLEGVWNGTGNFVLRYTGDCYIAIASITDKPLSEFSKSVSTQIKQTATNIQLLGENINKVDGTTTQLGLDLDAEKKSIRLYVDETDKANRTFTTAEIEASVGKVQAWVKNLDYATNTTVTSNVEILSGLITSTVSKVNANSTSITNIQQDIDTITQTVGQAATKEQLKENVATLNRAIDSARSHADDVGTGIRNDYASTITLVKQSSSSWSVAAGGFDSNGKLKSSAGAILETNFARIFTEAFDAKKGVVQSDISTFIRDEAGVKISYAQMSADNIILTGHCMNFTGGQITITTDNFTLDGRIRALAGVRNVSPQSIYHDLINDVTTIKVDQHRISSLTDMKHRVDNKHLMSEWQQPTYQSLSFDFTSKPVSFHDNGDGFGYYNTEPFCTVEEAEVFKEGMKPYSQLFPLFNSKYAYAFLDLDNHLSRTRTGYKIAWVKNDVPLKGSNYLDLINNYQSDYKWRVLLRYLAQNEDKYDLKAIYNGLFSKRYSSFSGFNQSVKRAKGKFINQLVVLKEKWDEKLGKYEN